MMDLRSTRAFKFWEKYEHHLGLGALCAGFVFDLFIADRPDSPANNLLLLSYLFVAAALIIVLNLRETRRQQAEHSPEPLFFLLILQFCFGGLASNLLVLYGRSGTLVGSAVFLGLLVLLILGNEYGRSRYAQLRFNVGVFYILLLSYCVIAVPTFVLHSIGPLVFLASGLVSLLAVGLFLTALFFTALRGRDTKSLRSVAAIVGGVFLLFNVLYFLNIIPPVPLSLKEIGVYHSILRQSSGNYIALYEKPPWWQPWITTNATYTLGTAQSAFCFSAVFAPTDLTAPIYHRWQRQHVSGEWETQSRVSFSISGGRAEGDRGWTTKSALTEGKWRCDVETAQGQLIGRTTFEVVQSSSTPTLSQTTL